MILALAWTATWVACAGLAPQESYYVDASLEPDASLLGWEAVNNLAGAEAPLRRDLVLAVRGDDGRELRIHACRPNGIDPVPRRSVPMLDDIIAWGSADLRPEAGNELLLLTRGGAWVYSIQKDGYRNNAAPIARVELIYDLPNPAALPHWDFVLPGPDGQGADRFLLPARDGFAVWSPDPEKEATWQPGTTFPVEHANTSSDRSLSAADNRSRGRARVALALKGDDIPLLADDEADAADLLSDSLAYRAPAMMDIDGNGSLDLLIWTKEGLAFHSAGASQATSLTPLPKYLTPDKSDLSLQLADLDGDGDIDFLARLKGESKGLSNSKVQVLTLLQSPGQLFPKKPNGVLRFEASELRTEVTDVNGDKRPDLVVRKFELPGLLESVNGLEFTFTHLVFFGGKRGFERKPSVKATEIYDEDSVAGVIANYELVRDCDGDGIADLAAIDLGGRLAVRRVQKSSGFFSGDSWSLEEAPWKRFETRGAISSLSVPDLNGDGLGDLVSLGSDRLTIMLSMTKGQSR